MAGSPLREDRARWKPRVDQSIAADGQYPFAEQVRVAFASLGEVNDLLGNGTEREPREYSSRGSLGLLSVVSLLGGVSLPGGATCRDNHEQAKAVPAAAGRNGRTEPARLRLRREGMAPTRSRSAPAATRTRLGPHVRPPR